jgi:glycosyltransferase involved in cell wall biosynthesis
MTPRRITVVASEILGVPGTGGPGTADSFLAIALGRHGHDVELLVAPGRDVSALNEEWRRKFAESNVRVRPLAGHGAVRPSFLAPAWHIHDALRSDPPDVVVADDWRALGYAALRSRQLGRSLAETAFVLYCHGPARVFAEAARKVPDTVARFGEEVAQRACLELADAVVSPSEWLVGWLRGHRWPIGESVRVIQNLWQSTALEEPVERIQTGSRIRRLAFFGQLREGKGIRIFLASLRQLDPQLLEGVELLFLGHTRRWTPAQIRDELGTRAVERLASIRVETQLERAAAIAELKVPGTLAVMPSLLENSPYAVAECIEHGLPFLAADVGGTSELVADEDRARVLCPPTPDDFAAALERALASRTGIEPARPARAPKKSLTAWLELIETVVPPSRPAKATAARVAVAACGDESVARARRLARQTRSAEVEVIRAESRRDGLYRSAAEWVVFLDDEDVPDDEMLDALLAAQAASDSDVVTSAVRPADDLDAVQLFLGDPGAFGLVENQYGVLGLVRASLAAGQPSLDSAVDPDWLLFARLALAGARVVSIPEPLSVQSGRPGTVRDVPGEGLAVLEAFEVRDTAPLPDLPQLTATLAASLAHLETHQPDSTVLSRGTVRRGLRALRSEGVAGVARRVKLHLGGGSDGRGVD